MDGFTYPCSYAAEILKNYCGIFGFISGWLFIQCSWLCLVVVFQSHLRVPGAWDSGARQSGIRATEVWVTLGSEGGGFEVGYSDKLR